MKSSPGRLLRSYHFLPNNGDFRAAWSAPPIELRKYFGIFDNKFVIRSLIREISAVARPSARFQWRLLNVAGCFSGAVYLLSVASFRRSLGDQGLRRGAVALVNRLDRCIT